MATLNHAEKDELIKELKAKLKEMKQLEKAVETTAAELSVPALGVHKDSDGKFYLIDVRYDLEQNVAAISKKIDLNSRDYAIALNKAKEYLVFQILKAGKL